MDTKQLYWTAGFLEGEGSFLFNRAGVVVSACQVQREPLERLKALFKGSIRSFKKPNRPTCQDAYIWELNGVRGAGLMMTLYTLMSPRRQGQIKTALDKWKERAVYSKWKTHCKNGHEYTEENTYRYLEHGKQVVRRCRLCQAQTRARMLEKKKVQVS